MKEKALKLWQKGLADFKSFSVGQKAATLAAVLALVVGGVLFSTWKSKPQYAPLFTNLAPADASSIIDKLNASHTPYQLGGDGTSINVPKDKVYSARIAMSAAGLPNSSQQGYDLLDQEGVTTSEFKQQVDYQRAIEGELAKTIKAINGIQDASVHLAIPEQNVFNDGTQKPTASVLLTTGGTTQLTQQQVQSIAYLVSSAVPNMAVEDVTLTDQHGTTLAAQGEDFAGAAGSDTQTTATTAYNDRIKTALQDMIDAVVGSGHAKVLYNATLDFNKQSTTSEQYVYSSGVPPLSEESSSEKYNGTQAGQGGILGASPTPTTAAGAGGSGNYSKDGTTKNNAVGKVTDTVQTAPGAVKQQSVSVVLDAAAKNVNLPVIQELVTSAIGLNATRGDTLSVQSLNFDKTDQVAKAAADSAAAKAAAAAAAKAHQEAMIKQGAIAGIALISIAVFLLMRRRRRKQIEPPAEEFGWYDDPYLPVAPEASQHAEEDDIAGEINEAQARRRALVTLASEQPDDVARVLSNWLNA